MNGEADFVVVGAGAAGLLAAVAAKRLGFEVLLIERTSYAGGTTSGSRGAMWLPGNDLMLGYGMARGCQLGGAARLRRGKFYRRHNG